MGSVTLGKFWDAVAGKLADRWRHRARRRWCSGRGEYWRGRSLGRDGLACQRSPTGLTARGAAAQVAALLGALVVVAASAIVVQRLTTPVLRLLEGYWPRWLHGLTDWRRGHVLRSKAADDKAWQRLQQR